MSRLSLVSDNGKEQRGWVPDPPNVFGCAATEVKQWLGMPPDMRPVYWRIRFKGWDGYHVELYGPRVVPATDPPTWPHLVVSRHDPTRSPIYFQIWLRRVSLDNSQLAAEINWHPELGDLDPRMDGVTIVTSQTDRNRLHRGLQLLTLPLDLRRTGRRPGTVTLTREQWFEKVPEVYRQCLDEGLATRDVDLAAALNIGVSTFYNYRAIYGDALPKDG